MKLPKLFIVPMSLFIVFKFGLFTGAYIAGAEGLKDATTAQIWACIIAMAFTCYGTFLIITEK